MSRRPENTNVYEAEWRVLTGSQREAGEDTARDTVKMPTGLRRGRWVEQRQAAASPRPELGDLSDRPGGGGHLMGEGKGTRTGWGGNCACSLSKPGGTLFEEETEEPRAHSPGIGPSVPQSPAWPGTRRPPAHGTAPPPQGPRRRQYCKSPR